MRNGIQIPTMKKKHIVMMMNLLEILGMKIKLSIDAASAAVVELNNLASEVSKLSNISISDLLVFKGCYVESTSGGSS
nr:hypothetical protein CFP56_30419 [Quercus suber]